MRTFAYVVCATLVAAVGISGQTAPTPTADQLERLQRAENRLKDWANLGRYHEANSMLAPPAKGEERVVFIGDSITDSWNLNEYFPSNPFINRGISGQTTPQMLVRFRPDVIDLKPRVVVILAGTNDIAGNTGPTTIEHIEENLTSMIELARANGIAVVIASVLPVGDHNKNKEGKPIIQTVRRPPEKVLELNRRIKNYAARHRVVYLDYFSAMVDGTGFLKEELAADGLHPNAQGYQVMKPLAEQAILAALKRKKRR